MNKKHFICAILLIGSFLLNGCGEQLDKLNEEEEAMVNEIVNKIKKDMESKKEEIFELLSNKYSIPKEKARLLINEYKKE